MRTIQSEFPDYDGVELDIPPFRPEPWHNDVCPRYTHRGGIPDTAGCFMNLWTEYVDPAKRESGGDLYLFEVTDEDLLCVKAWSAETLTELRSMLNAWYHEHAGYEPDADSLMYHGKPLPIGILMAQVGTVAYLHFKDLGR